MPNTVYLHTYLQYLKQTKTIQRNLLMIASLKQHLPAHRTDDSKKVTKPQDLARLYDIICQVCGPNFPEANVLVISVIRVGLCVEKTTPMQHQ